MGGRDAADAQRDRRPRRSRSRSPGSSAGRTSALFVVGREVGTVGITREG